MKNKSKNDVMDDVTNKTKNKKWKIFKNVVEYVIIFLVIFINAAMIYKSVNNPNKTPSIFGKKVFVIISGSMIPKIEIGDVVIINDTSDVKEGDIIAFRRDSKVIVHRIIKEMNVNGNTMYQTKGDNNDAADIELVESNDVEGVYVGKISYIGKLLMWLYNNLALVVVVLIVILLVRYYLG